MFEENKITVINNDGTKTSYVFNNSIKFRDKDNKIKFKDNSFKNSTKWNKLFVTYEYENAQSDKKLYLPKHIKNGVLYVDGDFSLELIPNVKKNSNAKQRDFVFADKKNSVVEYADAFGKGYHLQYAALNDGFKENILVEQYSGVNEFEFTLNIPGYYAQLSDGGITVKIYEKNSTEPIYVMNQPYVQDSYVGEFDGYDHFGFKNHYELEYISDGVYTVTMVIDQNYLTDSRTVYPVLIDPTTAIASSGSIEDTYVCQNNNDNHSEESVLRLGYDQENGQMSIFVRNTFMWYFRHIRPENIVSAQYCTEVLGCTTSIMSVGVFKGNGGGISTNYATYEQIQGNMGEAQSAFIWNPTMSIFWDFNISNMVKSWLKLYLGENGTSEYDGFIIDAPDDTPGYVNLRSANNPSGDFPCFRITYNEDISIPTGEYFIKNKETGKFLEHSESIYNYVIVKNYQTNDSDLKWYIYNSGNGLYTIQPCYGSNLYLQPENGAYSGNQALKTNYAAPEGNYPYYTWWRIVQNENGTYRLMPYITTLNAMGLVTNGNQADLFDYRGYENQTWELLVQPEQVNITGDDKITIFDTKQLYVSLYPQNSLYDITWSLKSGDEGKATISSGGVIHALKRGVVTVVATCSNGEVAEKEIIIMPIIATCLDRTYQPEFKYYTACSNNEEDAYYEELQRTKGYPTIHNEFVFTFKKSDVEMICDAVDRCSRMYKSEQLQSSIGQKRIDLDLQELWPTTIMDLIAECGSLFPKAGSIITCLTTLYEIEYSKISADIGEVLDDIAVQIQAAHDNNLLGDSEDDLFELRLKYSQKTILTIEYCIVYGNAVGKEINPVEGENLIRLGTSLLNYHNNFDKKDYVYRVLYNLGFQYATYVRSYNIVPELYYGRAGW